MPAKPANRAAVPTAWVDVVRHYWVGLHTWQVSYRASPNGSWQLAHATTQTEVVQKQNDEPTPKPDPSEAHEIAREAWDAAWEHLDTLDDVRRCDYKFGVYRLGDEGDLILAGETGQGGRLRPDSNELEDAPTDDDGTQSTNLTQSLIRERKDLVSEVVRMTRALASVGEKVALVLEKAGDLIQKAGDGDARRAEADGEARSDEAKFGTLTQIGLGYLDKKGPIWKAESEKKNRDEAAKSDATLEQICRAAAMAVDGPTAIQWEAAGFDWRAVVAVMHKAGEHPDWEDRVKQVMLQLENKPELWKMASATCSSAFVRVAVKLGISIG